MAEEAVKTELVSRYYADMDLVSFARLMVNDMAVRAGYPDIPSWQRGFFDRVQPRHTIEFIETAYTTEMVTFRRDESTADRWHPYAQVRHLASLCPTQKAAQRFVRQQELSYRKVIECGEANAKKYIQEQMRNELDSIERRLLWGGSVTT